MADPIVGATIRILLEKALSPATDRIALAFGFEDELRNLKESMEMIRAVLADADRRQSNDEAVQVWLKWLEGVAFDADDALDELHYETLRRQVVTYRNRQLKQSKASSERRRRNGDNEQACGDGEQKSIDSAQPPASCCFLSLLKKKKSSGES